DFLSVDGCGSLPALCSTARTFTWRSSAAIAHLRRALLWAVSSHSLRGLGGGGGVGQTLMTVEAGYARRGGRMDRLSGRTARLDACDHVTMLASGIVLGAHVIVNSLREHDTASVPRLLIAEIGGHFRDGVVEALSHVRVGLDEPVVLRDVTVAAAGMNTLGVVDMLRLQIVGVVHLGVRAMT